MCGRDAVRPAFYGCIRCDISAAERPEAGHRHADRKVGLDDIVELYVGSSEQNVEVRDPHVVKRERVHSDEHRQLYVEVLHDTDHHIVQVLSCQRAPNRVEIVQKNVFGRNCAADYPITRRLRPEDRDLLQSHQVWVVGPDFASKGLGALLELRRYEALESLGHQNRYELGVGLGDDMVDARADVDVTRHQRECTGALPGDRRVLRVGKLTFRNGIHGHGVVATHRRSKQQ